MKMTLNCHLIMFAVAILELVGMDHILVFLVLSQFITTNAVF